MKESKEKLYVVSFGNSNKYLYSYTEPDDADSLSKPNPFEAIEKQLKEYLQKEFPEVQNLAYYTSPRATEVYSDHAEKYASYPVLDEKGMKEIEKVLSTEIRNDMANKRFDLDAPWSNINKQNN